MAAILGADVPTVEAVVAEAAAEGGVCELANDNGEGQQVISGTRRRRRARGRPGQGARRPPQRHAAGLRPLPLRADAAGGRPPGRGAGRGCALAAPAVPVIANVTAEPVQDIGRHPRAAGAAGDRRGCAGARAWPPWPGSGVDGGDRVRRRQGADRPGQARRARRRRCTIVQEPADVEALAAQLAGSAA